jgi:hypothetical protein
MTEKEILENLEKISKTVYSFLESTSSLIVRISKILECDITVEIKIRQMEEYEIGIDVLKGDNQMFFDHIKPLFSHIWNSWTHNTNVFSISTRQILAFFNIHEYLEWIQCFDMDDESLLLWLKLK